MQISALMSVEPVTVAGDVSLDAAMRLMDEHSIGHLPVVEGGELVGMLSDRDVLAATGWLPARVHACRGAGGANDVPRQVADVMEAPAFSLEADMDIAEAPRLFLEHRFGCAPVLREGSLVGVLTEMDLLGAFADGAFGGRPQLDSPVRDHMGETPVTANWHTTLGEAVALCRAHGVRHLPVLEAGQLVGILSDRDLRRAAGAGRGDDTSVDEFVTRHPVAIAHDAALSEAARVMANRGVHGVPVVEGDFLVGIVTSTDVLAHCLAASEESA